jgi:hypothetical protein
VGGVLRKWGPDFLEGRFSGLPFRSGAICGPRAGSSKSGGSRRPARCAWPPHLSRLPRRRAGSRLRKVARFGVSRPGRFLPPRGACSARGVCDRHRTANVETLYSSTSARLIDLQVRAPCALPSISSLGGASLSGELAPLKHSALCRRSSTPSTPREYSSHQRTAARHRNSSHEVGATKRPASCPKHPRLTPRDPH